MMAQVIQVSAPSGVAIGHLDDDGYADFGVTSQAGGCPLFHGAATVVPEPEVHPCGTTALGDYDDDTCLDIALTTTDGLLVFLQTPG